MRSDRALTRLVFCGLAVADKQRRAEEAKAVFAATQRFSLDNGISGQLVFINGHYLGLIDGPTRAANALLRQIHADTRLQSPELLLRAKVNRPTFQSWSGAWVECSEPESQTRARLERLKLRLISDPKAHAVDYFRLMCTPNPEGVEAQPGDGRVLTKRIVFLGPSMLWGATAIQKLASLASVSTGRVTIEELHDPYRKSPIEYVDLKKPDDGPMRVTYMNEGADCAGIFSLLDGVDVLVFFALSSDLDSLVDCVGKWFSVSGIQASRPRVLIASSASPERIMALLENVQEISQQAIECVKVGLNDAGAVLQKVLDQLDVRSLPEGSSSNEHEMSEWMPELLDDEPPALVSEGPSAIATGEAQEALAGIAFTARCSQVEGLIQAAALRAEPAEVLLSWPQGADLRAASVADADWLILMSDVLRSLSPDDHTDDIMLTTNSHIYLYRPLPFDNTLWLAMTLDRECATGAVARMLLAEMASELGQANAALTQAS